jgi:DNA polymerase-3 subunit delta'
MHNILFATIKNAKNSTNPACNIKFKTAHPDLHFIYPTVSTEDKKNQKH